MQHLAVTFAMLAFGTGIASFMYVHRSYSTHALFFLKIFLRYMIVLNITVFLNLALHYLLTNVLSSLATHPKVMIVIVVNIIGFFLFSLMTFYFLLLTRTLVDKKIRKVEKNLIVTIIISASMAYGFSLALYSSSSDISLFLLFHKIFISILSLVSLTASIQLFASTKNLKDRPKIRTLRIFSFIYIGFFIYLLSLWVLPLSLWIMLSAFNLLLLNIIPIPLLSRFLREQGSRITDNADTKEAIERFYETFGLSQREKEIAGLILEGKSNKEIKEELFISIFTVKKHISNIFMKFDIKSRTQLIHRTMRAALADPTDSSKGKGSL